jgi:tetratricopeptide (TPR) repeat protein
VKKLLFIFILNLCFCGFAQNNLLFEKGNKAYNEGLYEEAAKQYETIINKGEHSPELYFNLGNTYYKLNKIAPSIYNFEKALLLKPNDEDIINNLSYAQNMALDAIATLPETGLSKLYNNITAKFSFDQWGYLSVILMFLFVLGYILYYFLSYATHKRIAFISSIICLFLALIAIVIAYLEYTKFNANQPAIVFDNEVIIKSEPNDRSAESFRLHEGAKVNVEETLDDWQKIKIADGKTGWLPSKSIKLLKDF